MVEFRRLKKINAHPDLIKKLNTIKLPLPDDDTIRRIIMNNKNMKKRLVTNPEFYNLVVKHPEFAKLETLGLDKRIIKQEEIEDDIIGKIKLRKLMLESPTLTQAIMEKIIQSLSSAEKKVYIKKHFFERGSEHSVFSDSYQRQSKIKSYQRQPKIESYRPLFKQGFIDLENLRENSVDFENKINARHNALFNQFEKLKDNNQTYKDVLKVLRDKTDRYSEELPLDRFIDYWILRNKPFLDEVKKIFK